MGINSQDSERFRALGDLLPVCFLAGNSTMVPLGCREVEAAKRRASDFQSSSPESNEAGKATQILSTGLKYRTLGIYEKGPGVQANDRRWGSLQPAL